MFVHLHCHSDRTVGRSLIKPSRLVERAVELGASAACLTDNATLSGAIQLYNACRKAGIKPIFGMEVNVAHDKSLKQQRSTTLVLLAKNYVGLTNLIKLTTVGAMYFYYQPRVDFHALAQYSEGIICLTSDLNGYAASRFFAAGSNGLASCYAELSQFYGDDIYWELQPNLTESQRVYNQALLNEAKANEHFRLVATIDPHYELAEDRDLFEKFLASRNFRNSYWEYPFRGDRHIMSEDEVCHAFDYLHGEGFFASSVELQEAVWRTSVISDLVESFDLRQGTKVPAYKE